MTSVQVDVRSLHAAAQRLGQEADQLAVAHDRAGSVLAGDVPHLQGAVAARARDMLQEALAACVRLGESHRRLADALNRAARDADQLESILAACLTRGNGSPA